MSEVKQYIIVRTDVTEKTGEPVSSGTLSLFVARASVSFLSNLVKFNSHRKVFCTAAERERSWVVSFIIDNVVKDWVDSDSDMVLLKASSLHTLDSIVEEAKAAGLVEGTDYFCVYDMCSLVRPDEGSDRSFVAVGFRPMDAGLLKWVDKRV